MSVALVTGASSGIGLELARLLASDRVDLVLVARRGALLFELATELKERHGVGVKVVPKDLSDPGAPDGLAAKLAADGIDVDVLVNSAGYATYGRFADADLRRELDLIQVDVVALAHLTGLLLPGMVARGRGRILNVASTAAFHPGPLMATYYASKAFVLSFSEALAVELEGTGVSVTTLCPGPTRSGFQARAEMESSRLVQGGLMTPQEVARAGYEALKRGDGIVVPGLKNKLGAQLPRVLPHRLAAKIVRRAQDRVDAGPAG